MNFLKGALVASFMLLICAANSFCQSEKDIIANYRKALQNSVVDSALKTMAFKGSFSIHKMTFPLTIYSHVPRRMRLELQFQSTVFLQVTNDSLKWDYNPITDKHTVTAVGNSSSNENSDTDKFMDFVNTNLLDYAQNKSKLKLEKKTKLDSVDVLALELTTHDNKKEKYYINAKTWLLYKIEDASGTRYFANYRTHNGIVFPHLLINSTPEQTIEMRFTQASFNIALSDSLFVIPEAVLADRNQKTGENLSLLDRAHLQYHNGHYDSAEILYNSVIRADGNNIVAYNSRGLARTHAKKYYEAISDFNRVLEIDPSDYNGWNNRGLAKYYLGDQRGALEDYTKSIQLKPDHVNLINRATLHMQMTEYEIALTDLEQLLLINAKGGEVHFKKGVCLAQLNRHDEAIRAYDSALVHNYGSADVYNYKGVSYYKLEQFAGAKTNFEKAMSLNATYAQYIQNYANALYKLEDYKAAQKHFEAYKNLKSDDPEAYNMIGLCKYWDEDYKGASVDFTKAIDLSKSKNATYFDNRAASKKMLDDYDGAIEDYTESIRIYPNDASVFYNRGLAKIMISKKLEGCLDLGTANEMKYEAAKEAIIKNCN